MSLLHAILALNAASVVPPLLVALYQFRRLSGVGLLLGMYCFVSFLTEIITLFLIFFGKELFGTNNNLWAIHLSSVIVFFLFSLIYFKTFSNKRIGKFILVMLPLVFAFSLADAFYFNGLTNFNSYAYPLQRGLLILYALLYLDKIFRELRVKRLDQDPLFLVSSVSLIYFSGSILIYSFGNILIASSKEVARQLYGIDAILLAVFQLGIALAVWHAGRRGAHAPIVE